MNPTPPPGSFGLAVIRGNAGPLIAVGEALLGSGSRYEHAFVVLDNGEVLEAEPGGAVISPLQRYVDRSGVGGDVVFCDAPVRKWMADAEARGYFLSDWGPTEAALRQRIVTSARKLGPTKDHPGIGYSFLDYLSLALAHWHIRPGFVKRYIASNRHAICSQLVDLVMQRAGIQLYNDGRLPGDVTPGDLDRYRIDALEAARA